MNEFLKKLFLQRAFMPAAAVATLGAVAAVLLAGCSHGPQADLQTFTAAMNTYLAQRGDLCLGKEHWPIDVTQREIRAHGRNAVQMPVLEHVGLVRSTEASVQASEDQPESAVTRYVLTDEGQKYFLPRQGAHDFCAARLALDKVVSWELPKGAKEGEEAVVSYTYKVDAASWTGDADVRRVFPMVDRVVRGAGTMQLKQAFRRTEAGWVPKDA
jgi:hypothetical protein